MTNPTPIDGPIPAGVIAAIDETVIYRGADVTDVLAAVVFRDARAARLAFHQLTSHRNRPFHWKKEGPTLRDQAVTLLVNHVATTHLLARPTGVRHRVEARRELLACLVGLLLNDGVDHVIIESSQVPITDGRDCDTILDAFQADRANRSFEYDWRTKDEPLLWYPDALAGVAHQFLAYGQTDHFRRLQRAEVIAEMCYPSSDH